MSHPDWQEPKESTCPKRVWVMSILCDDEALDEPGSLPQGLAFHLSRCDSCRALGDRLRSVSSRLAELAELAPDEALADRAHDQTLSALREGARLTGRVTIPDEPDRVTLPVHAGRRLRPARYAAAAVIVVTVGLYGLSRVSDSNRPEKPVPRSVAHRPVLRTDDRLETRSQADASKVASNGARGSDSFGPPSPPVVGPPPPGTEAKVPSRESPLLAESTSNDRLGSRSHADRGGPLEGGADSTPPDRASRCRHRTRLEAAMCDKIHSVHTAVVLPRRARRPQSGSTTVQTPHRPIDNPPAPVSTKPRPSG